MRMCGVKKVFRIVKCICLHIQRRNIWFFFSKKMTVFRVNNLSYSGKASIKGSHYWVYCTANYQRVVVYTWIGSRIRIHPLVSRNFTKCYTPGLTLDPVPTPGPPPKKKTGYELWPPKRTDKDTAYSINAGPSKSSPFSFNPWIWA